MATGTPDSGTQQLSANRVELSAELLELTDSFGDLRLLLLDQPGDAILGGAAVRAGPHRDQGGDLFAAQSHPPKRMVALALKQ